jgi:hypothetical protein
VPGRVYVTLDGHFDDDYHAYIYVSEDFGKTWRTITDGLPETSVHRIREHPSNPNVLVAGLETGVFASFDRGGHWTNLDNNLPPAPVYDLVFQERDGALVLGTHGRGIWIMDHAEPLGEITPDLPGKTGYLFPVPASHYRKIYTGQYWFGAGEFFAPNPASGAVISYYLPAETQDIRISIADATGKTIRTIRGPGQAGVNRTCWDLRRSDAYDNGFPLPGSCNGPGVRSGPLVLPGNYKVTLSSGGGLSLSTPVTVQPDPKFTISDADRKKRETSVMSAYSLQQQLVSARDAYEKLSGQVAAARANAGPSSGLDKLTTEAAEMLDQLRRCLTDAYNLEEAMDAYQGLPTGSQLHDLDTAWAEGIGAVTGLNRIIQQELPAWGVSGLTPVPVPAR